MGIYFQDDYHPTSNLTLNLGLRWDIQPGPYDNNFDTLALRAIAAAPRAARARSSVKASMALGSPPLTGASRKPTPLASHAAPTFCATSGLRSPRAS